MAKWTDEAGAEFWVSAVDGRDHSAEIIKPWGDIVIQWLTPGESGYQRVRLSQEQMDELALKWLKSRGFQMVGPYPDEE